MKNATKFNLALRTFICSLFLFLCFSCNDDIPSLSPPSVPPQTPPTQDEVDYFPLHIGDSRIVKEWSTPYTITTDAVVELDEKKYYRVTGGPVLDGTYYFRKTEDGKVYEKYRPDEPEYLRFDFNAEVGDQWEAPILQALGGDWIVTLKSKTETVEIGDCTFTNCYYFFYDRPEWFDDEHHIWVAPNIGVVKEHYYWGNRTDLVESHINGNSFSCE